ncbi:MAG: hypothetical protein ACXADX_15485 [Candidatus Hodarchaeales archaeon]|jgi:hypothetical protein
MSIKIQKKELEALRGRHIKKIEDKGAQGILRFAACLLFFLSKVVRRIRYQVPIEILRFPWPRTFVKAKTQHETEVFENYIIILRSRRKYETER